MYNFYLPQSNPNNLTGQVGGAISSSPFSGYLNELFYHVSAPPSGTTEYNQYRKVYIKNEFLVSSTETRAWLDAVDHNDQIFIGISTGGLNDSVSTPSTEPLVDEWLSPINYAEGIDLGTIATNGYTGIWLKQTLSDIVEEDPFATFRLYIGGIVSS